MTPAAQLYRAAIRAAMRGDHAETHRCLCAAIRVGKMADREGKMK